MAGWVLHHGLRWNVKDHSGSESQPACQLTWLNYNTFFFVVSQGIVKLATTHQLYVNHRVHDMQPMSQSHIASLFPFMQRHQHNGPSDACVCVRPTRLVPQITVAIHSSSFAQTVLAYSFVPRLTWTALTCE